MIIETKTHSHTPKRSRWQGIVGSLGLSTCLVLGGCSSAPPNPFDFIPDLNQSSDTTAQNPERFQADTDNPATQSYSATAPNSTTSQALNTETDSLTSETSAEAATETAIGPATDQLAPIQSLHTGAYFDNLPEDLQKAYYEIGIAAEYAQELVDIDVELDNDSLNAVLTALQNDRPDLFWLSGSASGMTQGGSTSIRLTYTATGDELAAQQKAFNARVEEILSQVEGLTPADQEKTVHDLLISQTSYIHDSQEKQGQSAYTALVEGRSVCAGYTRAFKHLMDELGIPCVYISGKALDSENSNSAEVIESEGSENINGTEPATDPTSGTTSEEIWSSHAWCIVSLDGNWYNVDITWDDNNLLNEESILYTHFNEADATFNQTHQRDSYTTFLPSAPTFFDFEGTYGITRAQAAADALGIPIYATVDNVESYQEVLNTLAWDTPDFNCDFYLIITDDVLVADLQNCWQSAIQSVYEERCFSGTISFNSTAQQLRPGESIAHIAISVA